MISIQCPSCGERHSWFYRFKFNYDTTTLLPCSKCHQELLDWDRFVLLSIAMAILFVVLMLFLPELGLVLESIITCSLPLLGTIILFPIKR